MQGELSSQKTSKLSLGKTGGEGGGGEEEGGREGRSERGGGRGGGMEGGEGGVKGRREGEEIEEKGVIMKILILFTMIIASSYNRRFFTL